MTDSDSVPPAIEYIQHSDEEASYKTIVLQPTGTSWYSAVFITVNAGLGAALLAFPQAFDMAGGITISVIGLVLIGIIALGSLVILAYCSDKTDTETYQDTVQKCCGQVINLFCSFVITLYSFGCCITYLILIGDQWDKVFDFAVTDPVTRLKWYLDRRFIITITSVAFIFPLSIPRRIEFLRHASAFGVVGICYVGLLLIAEYFTELPPPGPIKTRPDNWADVFMVLPTICFGYQCHITAVPIYASMRCRPNLRVFSVTSGLAILLCLAIYLVTGVFGYLSFGNLISADVLVDYPPRPEVVAGVALLAVKTYTTYPIMQLCGRSALQSCLLWITGWSTDRWLRVEPIWHHSCNVVWFVTSLLLALFVPDIGLVIGLLGGLACLFIFVFPGLCLLTTALRASHQKLNRQAVALLSCATFYTVFGTFVYGLTTAQSVQYIVQRFQQQELSISPLGNASLVDPSSPHAVGGGVGAGRNLFALLSGGHIG